MEMSKFELEQKKLSELQRETNRIMLELSNIFDGMDSIEMINNAEANSWMLSNLNILGKKKEISYEQIESKLKYALLLKVKEESVSKFLKEGFCIPVEDTRVISEVYRVTRIRFSDKDIYKINSESSEVYPYISFLVNENSPIVQFMIEKSNCEDLKDIQVKYIFGDKNQVYTEFKKIAINKLNHFFRDELMFIQKKLNEYYKTKSDWIFEINNEYMENMKVIK